MDQSFKYVSSFFPFGKDQEEPEIIKRARLADQEGQFEFLFARAKRTTTSFTGQKLTVNETAYAVKDSETGIRVELQPEEVNRRLHVLMIRQTQKKMTIGFFKSRKTLVHFREVFLNRLGYDSAYGRSIANQVQVPRSRHGRDWRKIKAENFLDVNGCPAKSLDRLTAFYLRTGLFIPLEWTNDGIMITMFSDRALSEQLADPDMHACLAMLDRFNVRYPLVNKKGKNSN